MAQEVERMDKKSEHVRIPVLIRFIIRGISLFITFWKMWRTEVPTYERL